LVERTPSESSRAPFWISGALLLAAFVIFGQTARHDFINFDDGTYIFNNPMVRRGLTLEGLRWSLTAVVASSLWHPLTLISHMVDVQLFGLRPGPHHLVNVFFHGLNAVVAFHALRLLSGATWRSAAVAALFAVHPLRVESVAWASERKDVLSALFFLLALCVYSRYVRTRKPRDYALLVGCFLLGIASKPMVITLPFVLLLLDYWPLGRHVSARAWSPTSFDESEGRLQPWRALVLEKTPLFIVAAGAAVSTAWSHGGSGALGALPVGARVANALVAYAVYVKQTFAPIRLAAMYPHPGAHVEWGMVTVALAVVGGITSAAWLLRPKHPYALIGWLWFTGMLVPVIGLVQIGWMAHADRYTYLPQIGLLIAVVWTVSESARRSGLPGWLMPSTAVIALGVLSSLAFLQVGYWRNSITLFEHTVRISPDSTQARVNLGASYADIGRLDLAVLQLRRAYEINPHNRRVKSNLGKILIELKHPAEAAELFQELVDAYPLKPDYQVMLAVALCDQGKFSEAVSRAQDALRIDPNEERAKSLIERCRKTLPSS
jgi:hypothetical protein